MTMINDTIEVWAELGPRYGRGFPKDFDNTELGRKLQDWADELEAVPFYSDTLPKVNELLEDINRKGFELAKEVQANFPERNVIYERSIWDNALPPMDGIVINEVNSYEEWFQLERDKNLPKFIEAFSKGKLVFNCYTWFKVCPSTKKETYGGVKYEFELWTPVKDFYFNMDSWGVCLDLDNGLKTDEEGRLIMATSSEDDSVVAMAAHVDVCKSKVIFHNFVIRGHCVDLTIEMPKRTWRMAKQKIHKKRKALVARM